PLRPVPFEERSPVVLGRIDMVADLEEEQAIAADFGLTLPGTDNQFHGRSLPFEYLTDLQRHVEKTAGTRGLDLDRLDHLGPHDQLTVVGHPLYAIADPQFRPRGGCDAEPGQEDY